MADSAITLVLLSAALHVGWNLLLKSSADARAFSAVKGIPLLALGCTTWLWMPLQLLPAELWVYIGISGVVHAVYVVALSTAYSKGDLSVVYPIVRSAPAFVPVAAVLVLGEQISVVAGLGITIVVSCIVVIQLWGSPEQGRMFPSSALLARNRWAFLTLASVVGYSLADKAGMQLFQQVDSADPMLRAPAYFLLTNAIAYTLYWGWMFGRGLPGVRDALCTEWKPAMLAAAGGMLSYSLILHVFETEKVSSVVALRQSSVLVAGLVGWLWLGEAGGRVRLLASAVLFAGLAIVALAD
jgi:drug/metabolite transporter (DMT)-like permease